MERQRVPIEKAIKALPEGNWIHVFVVDGDEEGEQWARSRIVNWMTKHGVEVSGENAAKHQHGLVSNGVFIQTRQP